MKYYFMATYLPEIHPDDRKMRVGFSDILDEQPQIAPEDWREMELILLAGDVLIVERLLSGKDVPSVHALHPAAFWKDQAKSPREGEPFILSAMERAQHEGFGPKSVDRLYAAYYDYVRSESRNDFLRSFFTFQRDLRNVLAALRARKMGLKPSEHLAGEGELVEILESSGMEDFGLSRDFPWIELLTTADDPLSLQHAVERVIWNFIEEKVGNDPFEFNAILGYLLKAQMVEKRLLLSQDEGMKRVHRLEEY